MAEGYNEIGNAAKTKSILDSIAPASEASKSLKYLALMPNILEQNGDLAGALQAYKDFYITIIGLRGKEVGEYMQLKRHYHISSDVRKKLGLDEHQTNIGIYIRKLMKQL